MRILANENITATVIRELRVRGHDVLSVKESMRGEKDDVILARAQAEERLLLTHDKDFGELAVRAGLPASCGIVLFRLAGTDPDSDNRRILDTLESRTDWPGHFSVVTDDRIRMRPLPGAPVNDEDASHA
jgi:predicted nuclease of predicted toxin-antitoxin system